ncbi:RNA-binding protein [Niastella vici]|uniref:RNA-binding protein n=1 Tax=Niastella vici TaxID=1703345 RepID=A0A1V9G245_9BACT|nr:VCBS repeat-containing protein [Niastella vici]OQP64691.1 RNA-binding protein [Niastella vici]
MKHIIKVLSVVTVLLIFLSACNNHHTLFETISSSHSGIHFNNIIVENDSINPIDMTNIYNGGGVGIGDFNNDGLQDVYFTGNLVPNKLYLNKGDLTFSDVTEQAGVTGAGRWCRGVTVVDINNDGLTDLYVCATMSSNATQRQNLLYINQGVDKNGVPQFRDMAAEYGLNDTTFSTMAAFFDYDNDGDLDMYLVVNEIRNKDNPSVFRPKVTDGSHYSTGRLYRNDYNTSLKHPVFTNVTREAGVTIEGYGHAVSIADFNKDGWKDIFVTNDFLSNDLLYINNHDGTFADKAATYFKHTSANGMGQDVVDINNDGLADVVELDMNPEDNYRKKMMLGANSYLIYQNSDYYHYQYQYVRNTLQLNLGPRVLQKDSIGDPVFADIGFLAGVAETDWSWAPLVQDFDNDGWRDILVTNGYPKDVTDHDFIAFRRQSNQVASKEFTLKQIPQVKIHNYAFRNNGNLTFSNETNDWGLTTPTFSNGAAWADLDNDGDLDFVVNNINDEAMVYKNTLRDKKPESAHYLRIHLQGNANNKNGSGAWITLHYQGQQQVYEQSPVRGYLSSVQGDAHFGLGKVTQVDSVVVKWPDGVMQVLQQVKVDQVLIVDRAKATIQYSWQQGVFAENALFTDLTAKTGIQYTQTENDFIDFNIQKLLPHKLSEYGPAVAVGDIDGNGLDDLVCGGSGGYSATLLLQNENGLFTTKSLEPGASEQTKPGEDMGIALFDADGDKDLDIFIAGGGYEHAPNDVAYADKLFINDGKGRFVLDTTAIPKNYTSKSCVRVADYDKDGDLDLFIAGRVEPGSYPKPVSSFLYRNDSKAGKMQFTDVTKSIAGCLDKIGLVCDAVWTDFDNDGWPDLLLAGEWMPLTFIKNTNGQFNNITPQTGVQDQKGWWTSLVPGDFDNDGDIDYIAGNLGLNSFYRGSAAYPVRMYAKDFDNNGVYDAIPSLYLPASAEPPQRKEFIAEMRDDVVKQVVGFKMKYPNYKKYAAASFDQMFTKEEMKNALVVQANIFSHCLVKNLGNGRFEIQPLPVFAQFSCLNGMLVQDFNGDGNLDVLINGNDYGTEVSVGRYDGCNGLLLQGDGTGGFRPLSLLQSGIFIPGNGKSLVELKDKLGNYMLAASQNRGPLKIYGLKKQVHCIAVGPQDVRAVVKYQNGKTQLREFNYGASFLSQSGRFIVLDSTVASVEVMDSRGGKRVLGVNGAGK